MEQPTIQCEPEGQSPRIRAREEIEFLKGQWEADPCWDLEETEGFEAHREELLAFSLEKKAEWQSQRDAAFRTKLEEMGIPDNPKLGQYILSLEKSIQYLAGQQEWAEAHLAQVVEDERKRLDNSVRKVRSGVEDLRYRMS